MYVDTHIFQILKYTLCILACTLQTVDDVNARPVAAVAPAVEGLAAITVGAH